MKTIKLFIISVLLLSSFQALAELKKGFFTLDENNEKVVNFMYEIKSLTVLSSSDRDQFIVSNNVVKMKPQNYEALDNTKKLWIRFSIERPNANGYKIYYYFEYTILDVNEAPKNIQLSNKTIEDGSASGTVIGTVTATDEDAGTDSTKLSYHLEGSTSNKDFSINSKGELSIKAKVDKKQKGDYYFSISASDPQGNKSKINFFI
ncbi:hypothetical protein BSPWISOXPB_2557 [uncultured Gammaproteobacteria bacterium]|nr:hypothetical protein BSPWISOXPB_2557 [uncultured Gammaproteobacteria bacterium]